MNPEFDSLLEAAKAILERNRAGSSTKPSPDLYPHQWMWDSCFIAVGLSRYDPERAEKEIEALLRGQWSNGMVPQIIFNPDSTGYFPGPDVWESDRSPLAPRDVQTSGITQPPVLATAAWKVFSRDPDRDRAERFGRSVYPKIRAYHEFLYRERNPGGSGLIVVVHPWESGLDNSPPYLDAGSRVHLTYKPTYQRLDTLHVAAANRPSNKDYDLFVWLLEQMRAVNYDWSAYLPVAALQVEDVLFNSILVQANSDLQRLAGALGIDEATERGVSPFDRYGTSEAIRQKLWDEGEQAYFSYDRVADQLLKDKTIVSLAPLLVQEWQDTTEHVEALNNRFSLWFRDTTYLCPTTAPDSKWFNQENYWLGPVWLNTNWLLHQGNLVLEEVRRRLRDDAVKLVATNGFREYFNPYSGDGYGTDSFSWTAALTIDFLHDAAGEI